MPYRDHEPRFFFFNSQSKVCRKIQKTLRASVVLDLNNLMIKFCKDCILFIHSSNKPWNKSKCYFEYLNE